MDYVKHISSALVCFYLNLIVVLTFSDNILALPHMIGLKSTFMIHCYDENLDSGMCMGWGLLTESIYVYVICIYLYAVSIYLNQVQLQLLMPDSQL